MKQLQTSRSLRASAIAIAALVGAMAGTAVLADDTTTKPAAIAAKKTADDRYLKDRADCENGRTAEDRATCLKEAGAAQQERARHTLDNDGQPQQNAVDRCNLLPTKDRADCVARVTGPVTSNQTVTTSGSVAGGGVLKETTTTTRGPLIVIVPTPAPPASAAAQ